MKKLIIILAVICILAAAGGGVFVWLYTSNKKSSDTTTQDAQGVATEAPVQEQVKATEEPKKEEAKVKYNKKDVNALYNAMKKSSDEEVWEKEHPEDWFGCEWHNFDGVMNVTVLDLNGRDFVKGKWDLSYCPILHEIDFSGTGVKEVLLPNTVTSVTNSFQNCPNLESVTFGKGVREVSADAFTGSTSLKKIVFRGKKPSGFTAPSGVTVVAK